MQQAHWKCGKSATVIIMSDHIGSILIHCPLKTVKIIYTEKIIEHTRTHTKNTKQNSVKKIGTPTCAKSCTYIAYIAYIHTVTPPQTRHIYVYKHAPACTCIRQKHPRPILEFPWIPPSSFSQLGWLRLFGCRGAEQRPVSFSSKCFPKEETTLKLLASWSTSHNCWPYVATFRARTCWNLLQNLGWTPAMKPQLKPHVPRCTENFMKWPNFHVMFGTLIFET